MSEDKDITLSESRLIELYQILYGENLFGLLSEDNYNLGKSLLEEHLGVEIEDLKNMGLKFTIDEHLNIASEMLNINETQTDFWKLVVKICYIILSIERNPFIAADIEELKGAIK